MRVLSVRGAVLLWAASIALMGVVVWQQLLALCFLAEGVVALGAWGLVSVLLWWLQEEALSGEGLVGQREGGTEAETERLSMVVGPCFVWLVGALLWGSWLKLIPAGPQQPRWLWVGEQALAGAFMTGVLVLELRVSWLVGPELARLSRWVLPRWWRWWRASRRGARGVSSLALWLLAVVMGVGGSLWLGQGLLWRLSLSALLVGLGALGFRLLDWLTRFGLARRTRFWEAMSRVRIWVMVLGIGVLFMLVLGMTMGQIWFGLWPASVGLALPGGGWQVGMEVLLLRLAFWCLAGASGRSGSWSGAGGRKESPARW